MKKIALLMVSILFAETLYGQNPGNAYDTERARIRERFESLRGNARQQYDDARRKAEADFAAFREKANAEFAAALQNDWKGMDLVPAIPRPEEDKPPKPPVPSPDRKPTTVPLPQSEVKPVDIPRQPTIPSPPVPEPEPATPTIQYDVYGTTCTAHADAADLRFKLASVDEKGAARAWKTLSQSKYDGLLHDCLEQRDALQLGDWGYLKLLQSVSEKLLGSGSNEAVLMQMYLLTQSGYCVRLAKVNGRFVLLVPFNRSIYNYPFVSIDGLNYYVLTDTKATDLDICKVGFPREQVASIQLTTLPKLAAAASPGRTFAAKRFGSMTANVRVNRSLIEFMNDYPLSDSWDCYALAGLSETVKADLYPVLRNQISGKSKAEGAAMLLNFVQTAFDYATDQDQFGYERPLFGDESFYYPKNDCEDRSILFSILVRDLLGLDVVLVHWPGHLGTAVCFREEVIGDYFVIDGQRYTICDPTYIGAGVGETMPQFRGVSARLVRL